MLLRIMKKPSLIILLFTCFTISVTVAQVAEGKANTSSLGLTFSSFGSNDVIYFQQMDGAASYNGDHFYTLGFAYLYRFSKHSELETGIEYSSHKIIINPNVPPDADDTPYGSGFSLINIPVSLRFTFAKYFFLHGGLLLDIDPTLSSPIDNQTGLGAGLGLGGKYGFPCGISVFINPYLKAHSLIPFTPDDNHQHVMESGFRFGMTYTLN